MSHNTLFKVVATVIALSAGLAFTPVGAQATTTELVTTECGAGQATVCGHKPAQITCSFGFSVTPTAGLWGFSISFGSCKEHGSVSIFKDFERKKASGVCVQTQKFPADATRSKDDEEYMPEVQGEESC
ncbi:MAG: hypothetical protein HEQ38_09950 [Gemmatimonas sp.]|jgi:hypothetical protein|uniref:hypothetical protein n=1 Tax=Gemmatimonas sp. TaxID=1962908 RepID=UPI0031BE4AD2|nr:hypothetical protein [Gemmatimonas sp.]